jgi:O-antigen/teichoic acid export membrane protein
MVTFGVGMATSAILVLGFRIGVMGALIGQPVGATAGAIVAFAFSRSLYMFRFDWDRLKRMLAFSIPLIPASIGVFLNAYADRIAIRTRLGVTEVGVYGAGYRLSLIVSLILLGLQGALSPLVLSHHKEAQTRRELARLFRLFSAIALAVFLMVSLFAIELLHLLTRPAYYAGATIVPFVIAASFFGGMYVFAPGLNIVKRTRLLGLVVGLTGVVNLILAFALIGPLGIRGAALAFLLACGAGFVTVMALSQRVYPVPHDWRRLLPRAVAVGAIVAIASAVLGETVSTGTFLIKVALAVLGLAIIGGLANRAELRGLWRLLRASARSLRHVPRKALRRQRATPA